LIHINGWHITLNVIDLQSIVDAVEWCKDHPESIDAPRGDDGGSGGGDVTTTPDCPPWPIFKPRFSTRDGSARAPRKTLE
jgi:hypothetical protein